MVIQFKECVMYWNIYSISVSNDTVTNIVFYFFLKAGHGLIYITSKLLCVLFFKNTSIETGLYHRRIDFILCLFVPRNEDINKYLKKIYVERSSWLQVNLTFSRPAKS